MSPAYYFTWGIGLLQCFGPVIPARILFLFPLEIPSNFRAFKPVVEELAVRGHEIIAYVHPKFKREEPLENYREIIVQTDSDTQGFNFVEMLNATAFEYTWRLMWKYWQNRTETALQTPTLRGLMESQEHFDLIMMEATCQQEPFLGFADKFGAPVVNLHPFFMSPLISSLTGTPNPLSYVPDFRLPYTERMSYWQRLHNVIFAIFELVGGYLYFLPGQDEIMRRNFRSETLPPLIGLVANISLHLVLYHPMVHIRPYSPNVVQIAGMQNKTAGNLPQDVKKFMDDAPNGVIYVSFGSMLDPTLLPARVKTTILEALKNVEQRVILKWPEKIDGNPTNILQKSWAPQTEILAHPRCKLFITHGGYNSLVEAMSAGVPVLGLPVFADQYHNVAYYEHVGVGLGTTIDTLTEEEFLGKMKKILFTPSFAEKAKRCASIFRDLPESGLQRAIYWVEYVIRHRGAHHLKPASVSLPFYKNMLLDVIAFCSASFIFIIFILIWIIRKILFDILQKSKRKPEITSTNKKHN